MAQTAERRITLNEYLYFSQHCNRSIYNGPYNHAFQSSTTCRGLRRLGVNCISAELNPHPFGAQSDLQINNECDKNCYAKLRQATDIFHFQEFSCPYEGLLSFPKLREDGKCVVLSTHGTEYRPSTPCAQMFQKYGKNCPCSVADGRALSRLKWANATTNAVTTGDYELMSYGKEYYREVVPRMLDSRQIAYLPVPLVSTTIRVLHAPSNPAVKGTTLFERAVAQLKSEGVALEYIKLMGKTHDEVLRLMESVDIIADQFLIGWYGVLTTEALMMGKPVLVYIRPDVVENTWGTDKDLPIVNVQSYEEMVSQLKRLVTDAKFRTEVGKRARAYALKSHGVDSQVGNLIHFYEKVCDKDVVPVNNKVVEEMKTDAQLNSVQLFCYDR